MPAGEMRQDWQSVGLSAVSVMSDLGNHLEAGIGPFPSQETDLALKHGNTYKDSLGLE